MLEWNRWLFGLIAAGHRTDPPLMGLARWIADHGAEIGILALVVLWCARPAQRGAVVGVALMAGLASLVAHALADAFDLPRPFVAGDSAPWIAHGGRGAFPSAHASVMFTAALGLLPLPGLRWAAAAMAALGVATAWARIYGGLHYPLDIAGGLLLAAVLVHGLRLGASRLRDRLAHRRTRRLLRRWRTAGSLWWARRAS